MKPAHPRSPPNKAAARPLQPSPEPGQASAEDGVVLLDGPHGVAVAMTPDAARQTSEQLRRAADEAERGAAG